MNGASPIHGIAATITQLAMTGQGLSPGPPVGLKPSLNGLEQIGEWKPFGLKTGNFLGVCPTPAGFNRLRPIEPELQLAAGAVKEIIPR